MSRTYSGGTSFKLLAVFATALCLSAVCQATTVATPTFSPAAGTYSNPQSVAINDSTSGAVIFYTTNGNTPTTSSTPYSGSIAVGANETVKAIATKSGFTQSAVGSAAYTINAATPTFSPAAGTYSSAQTVTISDSTSGVTIHYTTNGSTPTASSTTYTGPVAVSADGTLKAIAIGTNNGISLTGTAAYTIEAATPTFSPVAGTYSSAQSVTISDSTSGSTIYYTTNGTTPTTSSTKYTGVITVSQDETVEAIATATSFGQSPTGTAVYAIDAATPTFSPTAGAYGSPQTVTISDSTSGATIYYTTNGTTPTTSSSVYSGPINVSSSETVEAIATATHYAQSLTGSAAYTIQTATPTFSPAAGTYYSTQSVTIGDVTSGSTIYYSTNGSTPTTSSPVYSSPLTVSSTETVEAIATAPGFPQSATGTAAYTIQAPPPTFSPAAGTYFSPQTVTISDSSSTAIIYYTTDGTTPTTSSAVYGSPIAVNSTETVKAIAAVAGYPNSSVASGTYTVQAPTPTISPISGTYLGEQSSVVMTDSNPSATIYYTEDGTSPTTSSEQYVQGPSGFGVDVSETVKAIAVVIGYANSAVASVTYSIEALPPSFSLAAGSFVGTQTLTITSENGRGTKIYYTTNGTTPTTSSSRYSTPLSITSSGTVEAIAVFTGMANSPVTSAVYTITSVPATPTLTPIGGAYPGSTLVSIADGSANATIYYTVTNGTTGAAPTTSSTVYTGTLTVSSTQTVEALAGVTGFSSSPVASGTYTIPTISPSNTSLSVSSGGQTVASAPLGQNVTLTATVQSGSSPITGGIVNFCDATSANCSDIHLIGTAQVTSAGMATIHVLPGIGSHSYKAAFIGNTNYESSSSSSASLVVTGSYPTTTTVSENVGGYTPGNYSLNVQVTGTGSATLAPTGAVSILDAANGNAVLGTGTLSGASQAVNFANPSILPFPETSMYTQPLAVVGDFNGDGKPDIAVYSFEASTGITIFLSNGDGTFTQAPNTPIAMAPGTPYGVSAIAVGDFNGDGKLDIATLTGDSGGTAVTILLGNGDGTFILTSSQPTACWYSGNSLVVADLNQDGKLDLAIPCGPTASGGGLYVMLGNGDGTFAQAAGTPQALNDGDAVYAAVGDFNGDGIPDLALVNIDGEGSITILMGNGDGTFTEPSGSPITAGYEPESLAIGDFNHDGKQDIAVADWYNFRLTILLGNGDGTFTQKEQVLVGNGPFSVAVADFNQDGIPDLVVGNNYDGSLSYLQGNGDGSFFTLATTASVAFPQALRGSWNLNGPWSVVVGDFNRDGIPDVATVIAGVPSDVYVQTTDFTETATAMVNQIAPTGSGPHNVTASYGGDLNFTGSTSSPLTLQTVPDGLVAALVPSESYLGSPVTVNFTFLPQNGALPTGTVSCAGAGVTSTTATMSATPTASVQLTGLPLGKDSIVCTFITSNPSTYSNAASSTLIETVIAPPQAGTVSVSPASTTLYPGQSQQFSALVANTTNQSVTWSVSPFGSGTISATGLYAAPTTVTAPETVTITATSVANSAQSGSAMISLAPPACASAGYSYEHSIVIDHTKVPNTDETDFPFLFKTTDLTFASTSNGGHVSSANGYDIIFSTDPGGLTKLDHEMEEYNPSTGQVVAWVRIPKLSHTSDTILYVFYGNSTVTTPQQNPTGVWDANNTAVYHLVNIGTGIATDSTANQNNGTVNSASTGFGEVYGGAALNGSFSYLQIPSVDFPTYPTSGSSTTGFSATFGVWFKTNSSGVILGQTDGTAPGGSPTGWQPALYIDNATGRLRAAMFSHGSAADQIISQSAYNDNNWHFAVDTYTNGTEELFVDGTLVGSQQASETAYNSTYAYFVGTGEANNWQNTNESWFYFNGAIDEIHSSNIARSADWIQTEFNNQSSPSTFYAFYPENTEEIIPAAVTLTASQSQQLTVVTADPGSCVTPASTWYKPSDIAGTLTATGLYTAPSSIDQQQIITIVGKTLGSSIQSATATITLMPPVAVSVTPNIVTLGGGQSQQFTVTVNNSTNSAVTWAISPSNAGSFTAPGLYTAPSSVTAPQTVVITATSLADPSQSSSATIVLAPPDQPTNQMGISPRAATLYAGQFQQFTASVPNTDNAAVTWTINPAGIGSVSSSGLYTAPSTISTEQTIVITATSQADPTQSISAQVVLAPAACTSSGYTYARQILINHTEVPNTDQANFPYLFSVTDPLLATTANGGHVESPSGYDIVFSQDPNGLSLLNFEVEYYNPATGQLIAWVNIPALSHTSDTMLYLFYGNSAIATSQQNSSGVWDSNFQAVYHLANLGTGTAIDSTVNQVNGTVSSVNPITGEIDGAGSFNGSSSEISTGYVQNSVTAYTVEAWINSISGNVGIVEDDRSSGGHSLTFGLDGIGGCGLNSCGNLEDIWVHSGELLFGDDSNFIFIGAETPMPVTDGSWHHVVGTWSAASGSSVDPSQFNLYLDGQPVSNLFTIDRGSDTSPLTGLGGTVLGNGMGGFSGSIDEIRISSVVRSPDWIAAEYANQSGKPAFSSVSQEMTLSVAPNTVTLYPSQSQQFAAVGMCGSGIQWTMPEGSPGTLSTGGLYTAPSTITEQQSITITATDQTNQSETATVTLMPQAVVSLTPSSITLTADQTQLMTATVSNAVNQGVTWSISPAGVGSIDPSGAYTAPATITTQQTVTITATSIADAIVSASATITLVPVTCASNGYGYQRVIVIDHTKVPNSNQINFPFLFNTTDLDLASVDHGGHVASTTGNDIIFSEDPNGLTKLDYELEQYNPLTGQVVAWVRIPDLSHTTDTTLYMFYGNPNISVPEQNPAGVWDGEYQAVYHLGNSGGASAADSTVFANNAALTSTSASSGEIDGAAALNGSSSYIQIPGTDFPTFPTGQYDDLGLPPTGTTTPFTASFGLWFKTSSPGGILEQVPSQICVYLLGVCTMQIPTEPGADQPSGWNDMLYVDDTGHLIGNAGTSSAAYNDNSWHFAVMTFASDGTDTLYVDGKSVASQQAIPTGYSSAYNYFVGTDYTFQAYEGNWDWLYFNGNLDEVTVANTAFSADWIQTEYNNQSSPSTFYAFYSRSAVQVAPAAVSLYASQTQQFSVPGSCDSVVSFSIPAGAPGTMTLGGLYTAPASVPSTQSVTVTASSVPGGSSVGSSTVTLLPPPTPIALMASSASPYAIGSTQSFTSALLNPDGTPVIGATVSFSVSGANSTNGSAVTSSDGIATYSYTGALVGTDTIQATASVDGQMLVSNSVQVTWNNPAASGSTAGIALSGPQALGAAGLMGAFINNTGTVIEPIAIGASPQEFTVPAGATKLQVGVDSTYFPADGGPGFVVSVNGGQVDVPPTAMPWTWTVGGLNDHYQYGILNSSIQGGILDGTNPVIAASGLTPGQTVNISYQSGSASENLALHPQVNANGDPTLITNTTESQGIYFPTLYTTPSAYPVGQPIPFSAIVTNSAGAPAADVAVTLTVSGSNPGEYAATTDSTGTAAFLYTGTNAGTDSLQAQATVAGSSLSSNLGGVTWVNPPTPSTPGTLSLVFWASVNDAQGYALTLTDSSGNPIPNVDVGFYVWGVDNFSQDSTTDITGHTFFTYNHARPGPYNLIAVATVNGNILYSSVISGVWTPPTTTNGCNNCNNVTVSIAADTSVIMPNAMQLTGTVTDNVGISPQIQWSQVSGPGVATFATPQQASTTATFSQIGTYVVQLYASDSGNNATAQFTVSVLPTPVAAASQGWVASPLYGAAVSGIVPITLAPGLTLASGTLSYMPTTNTNSVTVLNSTATGSGEIGQLDTTALPNGSYWIQLQATDAQGSSQYSLVMVTVQGNYKPGRVTSTVTDLVVPATGLSISIQRRYDSLNAGTSSDFGYGWSLGVNVDLSVDPLGNVTFTLGGQRKTFYLAPQAPPCTILGCLFPYYFAAYTPEPGLHGTLTDSGQGCPLDILVPNGSIWECQDGSQFSPSGYTYTDTNGTQYSISPTGGLQSITDHNGNGLTIAAGGITSTTGLSVPFVRDSQNRITQITDPQGNTYQYSYDDNGNLASVTYPNTTQPSTYTYAANHYYLSGTDFRSNPLPSTQYYAVGETDTEGNPVAGKLESVTDSVGETTTYAYNLSTNTTTITYPPDAGGNVGHATMVYDSSGDLLSSTDPLGHTTTNTYDTKQNLLSTTDPLGHTTSYTYDSNGNKTSQTYPATAASTNTTSTTAYNQYSEPTSTTDELGNERTFNYDANYNPQSVTDGLGTLVSTIFNSNGTLQAGASGYDISQAPNQASQFGYDANGDLISKTDALGRTSTYTYNSLGQKTSMTEPPAASSTSVTARTTTYQYDAFGNLTQTTAPLGRVTSSTYDGSGNKLSAADARGNTTQYQYDALNRLVLTTYPDSTTASETYDFRNNLVTEADQDGHVIYYQYDLAGRQTAVTQAYGTSNATTTSYAYDNAGRKTSETDALGHVTNYTYDAAGNLLSTSGVQGNFSYTYDNARNRISMTDANNHTTQFAYDARKRLTLTTYPDQTTQTNAYDGPGNLVSVTDQAGNQVHYTYDAANQLASVVQVNSPNTGADTTSYVYDLDGNLISLEDANSHTTLQSFDPLNELMSKTLPDGTLTEMRTYDNNGDLATVIHFNGVTTTYTYDQLNRLLSRATPGETTISFTYTPTGKYATFSDASGTTTYSYDSMDRLTAEATPEGTLNYTYDAAGHVASISSSNTDGASMSYTYDNFNRLSTVADNRLNGSNVTTYTYDPASNVATATYPNGVQSTFTYDTLNRFSGLSSQSANYTYQRGSTGNLTSVTELSGRTVNWSYDGIYRLTNEAITSAPSGNNGSVGYGLDPVGNRLAESSSLPDISSGMWSFNTDDELSSESYDQNGNVTAAGGKSFTYDSENHLISTTASGTSVSPVYDAFGNRVAKTVNGVTTKFLVESDRNPTGYPQVFDELNGSGVVTRTYTYGLQRINEDQMVEGAWTPSFYGYDGGGSVRQLTNTSGAVTDSYEYDAFGNKFTVSGSTPNNYLYRGEQYDPDLGLYYLRARYYRPLSGRFMSLDPQDGDYTEPLSRHRYIYANDDPVYLSDPSGRMFTAGRISNTRLCGGAIQEYLCLGMMATLTIETAVHFNGLALQNAFGQIGDQLGVEPVPEPGNPPPPGLPPGCTSLAECAKQGTQVKSWKQAENWLHEKFGGEPQVSKQTPYGPRIIDNLTDDGIAQEAKYGRQSLDTDTMLQAEKDLELLETPSSGVKGVQWYFFDNAAGQGPSLNLVNYLINNGIEVFINGVKFI